MPGFLGVVTLVLAAVLMFVDRTLPAGSSILAKALMSVTLALAGSAVVCLLQGLVKLVLSAGAAAGPDGRSGAREFLWGVVGSVLSVILVPVVFVQLHVSYARAMLRPLNAAVQQYRKDRGHYPDTLVELVPAYVDERVAPACQVVRYSRYPSRDPRQDTYQLEYFESSIRP